MSDVRVSVQWKNPTVFAGENIECIITFKNIALGRSLRRSPSPKPTQTSHRERWKETLPTRFANNTAGAKHTKSTSFSGFLQSKPSKYRSGLSTGSGTGFPKFPTDNNADGTSDTASFGDIKQQKSISIVSIGGEPNDETLQHCQTLNSGRPSRSHGRAASLYVLPQGSGLFSNESSLSGISLFAFYTTRSPIAQHLDIREPEPFLRHSSAPPLRMQKNAWACKLYLAQSPN